MRPSAGPTRPCPIRCRPASSVLLPSFRNRCSGRRSRTTGDTVRYRLDYGNGSTAAALGSAVLTDTLPNGFDYVTSQPAATVTGRVLQWSLGDLPPGARRPGDGHAHRLRERDRHPEGAEQCRPRLDERVDSGCDRVRGAARRAAVTLACPGQDRRRARGGTRRDRSVYPGRDEHRCPPARRPSHRGPIAGGRAILPQHPERSRFGG